MENKTTTLHSERKAALLLADGTLFFGDAIGAAGQVYGEICFNTGMAGYQEVLTDPSYSGQIITFTFPHIGNVGCNPQDIESAEELSLGAKGLVVREQITTPSNFRSTLHFNDWLIEQGVVGISGVDTRFLTRHIRQNRAKNAVILSGSQEEINSQLQQAQAKLAAMPSLKGMELAEGVSTKSKYNYAAKTPNPKKIVAIDYGEKLNILRYLSAYGCEVTIVPATTTAEEILSLNPQGIFLSNGPGDPAATGKYAIPVIQKLIAADLPLFGICLGHQLLALALGGKTEKMPQGHRGVNHPVKNIATGKVEITSQNHGFVVQEDSLPANVPVTHRSLFDGSVEGICLKDKPVFSVQYHPESSPGPHDSLYLFEQFVQTLKD